MLVKYLLFFLILNSFVYSKHIMKDMLLNNKESFQVSTCSGLECVANTEVALEHYDFITTFNNNYYVIYVVNIDATNKEQIRKELQNRFPDMILKNANFINEKLQFLETHNQVLSNTKYTSNAFLEKYKTALEYFKNKNYAKSYTLLNELLGTKQNDLNLNFYLGRSAYEIKRFDEAVSAYERFLFKKPDNMRVNLEMARTFFMTNVYKESKKLFLEVKKDPKIPKETLVIVDSYLKLIDKRTSKHFINGAIIIGVNYDSNYGSQDESNYFDYYNDKAIIGANSVAVEDDSAWYNQEIALINYKYKMNDKQEIKQEVMIFNKDSFHSQYNSTDITLLSYTPALSVHYTPKFSIDYALYMDYLKYGGKSKLKTIALFPQFVYKNDVNNKYFGYIKYQKKIDMQDKTQNSKYTEAGISFNHIYNYQIDFTSNITLTDEKADDKTQTDIDYTGVKAKFLSNYKYNPTLFITPSISYDITKYKNKDQVDLVKKENKRFKFGVSSTYIYTPQWIIQSNIDYTKQSSNILINEYSKHTFTLNLIRAF